MARHFSFLTFPFSCLLFVVLNCTLAVMSVFFISGEGKLGGSREYGMQDNVITTSLGITGSVGGSGTIVSAGSSLGVIGSVEGSSLVLMLELVRDPLEITGSVEDSLLVPRLGVIGSW